MSKILINKIITDIKIAEDKQAIKLLTTEGEIIARADGDCCSHSWIESIELPALGFPALVISFGDIDMPDLGCPPDEECVSYYGFKIVTDKGEIIIDYRNSSNGYYGGSLSWPDNGYFYGGVHGQNISDEKWVEINS